MALKSIAVFLNFGDGKDEIKVGELVLDSKLIHFKYDEHFLQEKWELSPLKLHKTTEIITGDPRLFEGLPGLFHDSLPDSWGRLLVQVVVLQLVHTKNATIPVWRVM